jgi:preprotein translocase subunit SecF
MEFFKKVTHIDFMAKRQPAAIFSIVLTLVAVSSFFVRGFSFGLDFTGGTLIEVAYGQPVDLADVRQDLAKAGFGDAVVQNFGTVRDVLVRLQPRENVSSADLSGQVLQALKAGTEDQVDMRRVEFVGSQVGDELVEQGGLAMLYALIGILIYVAFRFEWRFAVGAIVATVHDTITVLAVFSLLQLQFDLTVLAAVLAVIGYSLNDTIVVFDRIRENFRKMRKADSVEVVNASTNQTLSRTLMTSGTTLLVVVALYFLGGELIHGFAAALIIGIVIGTYSSIYVAAPAALLLGASREHYILPKKEGAEAERSP